MDWERKAQRQSTIFITSYVVTYTYILGAHYVYSSNMITWYVVTWYWPQSPGWSNTSQTSLLWNYSSPPTLLSILHLEGSHYAHLRNGELCSTSLKAVCLHNLRGILHRRFICSPPLLNIFSHLYQCGFVGICLIIWVTIQYYLILLLRLFHLWPLGALSVGFCVLLT